jgi:hypothetical protein
MVCRRWIIWLWLEVQVRDLELAAEAVLVVLELAHRFL